MDTGAERERRSERQNLARQRPRRHLRHGQHPQVRPLRPIRCVAMLILCPLPGLAGPVSLQARLGWILKGGY